MYIINNMEKAKPFDMLNLQAGANQSEQADGENSFRNYVQRAFQERNEQGNSETANQAAESQQDEPASAIAEDAGAQAAEVANQDEQVTDMQMAVLLGMMAEANVKVANMTKAYASLEGDKAEMQSKTDAGTQVSEKMQQGKDMQQTGQQTQQTQEAPKAAVTKEQTVTAKAQEQANTSKQEGQQTFKAATAEKTSKSESTVAKEQMPVQNKNEQSVLKQAQANQAAAKQQDTKEVKQEMAAFNKQEPAINPEKVIYVKVGDGGELDSEEFTAKLSEKILKNLASGKQSFEVELMPRDLGKIVVKLIVSNGNVQLIMQCLNPKTQQLVMMSSDAIRNIVEDKTGMNTYVSGEDAKEAYDASQEKENSNKQSKEGQQNEKMTEAEADIFLDRLKFGLKEQEQQIL